MKRRSRSSPGSRARFPTIRRSESGSKVTAARGRSRRGPLSGPALPGGWRRGSPRCPRSLAGRISRVRSWVRRATQPRCFRGRPAGLRSCAEPMAKRCSCRRPCVESTPHRLQLEAEDRPLAPWIAGVFQGWMRSDTALTYVERLAEVAPSVDPDETWYGLNYTAGGDGERLEVDRLRRGLRVRRRPDALLFEQKRCGWSQAFIAPRAWSSILLRLWNRTTAYAIPTILPKRRAFSTSRSRVLGTTFPTQAPVGFSHGCQGGRGPEAPHGESTLEDESGRVVRRRFDRSHAPSTELPSECGRASS